MLSVRVFKLLFCLALLGVCRAAPEDVYIKVVGLLSPGEEYLSETALHSFFKLLEKRVQCADVSCEKVRLFFFRFALQRTFKGSRSKHTPGQVPCATLSLRLTLNTRSVLFKHTHLYFTLKVLG